MENEVREARRFIDMALDFLVNYSFQVVGAVLVLILGVIVARVVASFLLGLFQRKDIDVTLSKFIASTAKVTILLFAVVISLGKFGITVAPFIAALAAMAFGASFAIQGPLSNYGAGLVIILTRPFVVGNTITVSGVSGVVDEVKLGATNLIDEDGVEITIPNKHIVGEILHNSHENKIVEGLVGIAYDSNAEDAVDIIRKTLDTFEDVSKNPAPQIGIEAFADSSINVGFRYWVPTQRYFQTLHRVNLSVYRELKRAQIDIPFPQRDIHMVPRKKTPLSSEA
jgi:small conductance mechanosensitive channel